MVAERRYLAQPQPAGLVSALQRRDVAVRIVEADQRAVRVGDDADRLESAELVVVRGRSTATLALAASAEAAGVPTLNARAATEKVRNKAELAVALAQADIPCPSTYLGDPGQLAAAIRAADYPVVLKPVFGDNSRGLRRVGGAGALRRVHWPEAVALAQRYVPSDGIDLKLYAIGDRVFAVRKPSPWLPDGGAASSRAAMPVAVTPALRELALRCGRLFGLELFGVDCVEGPDGPLVIEVNEFPNYTGVPNADELLADHVLMCLARRGADVTAQEASV